MRSTFPIEPQRVDPNTKIVDTERVMAKETYTGKDIQVLSDREHVRLRTQVYLGNMHPTTYQVPVFVNGGIQIRDFTFTPAVYKAVGEILDNSIDEHAQSGGRRKKLMIEADPETGSYTISDNGRGIPIDKHETGKYTPEVALGSLRAGRNFGADKDEGVIGQNGVGSACTNYCSGNFSIEVHRDGKRYWQEFHNGAEKVLKPKITKVKTTTANKGTSVGFCLDHELPWDVSLPYEMMQNRALEIAMTNPDITVDFNGTAYRYGGGLSDVVKEVVGESSMIQMDDESDRSAFKFEYEKDGMVLEFHVILGVNDEIDEQVFTWVNSSLLFDGGICNTQFMNAFVDRAIKQLQPAAKKAKVEITKNDVRQGILVLASLKVADPEYDAQSKTRLTGPNLRLPINKMVEDGWAGFVRKNKQWLEIVLERAMVRYHARANKAAIKDHQKGLHKKVAGLIDANSTNRFECQLLVTEGESAASMITSARDTNTTASLPLTGKVNNVYGTTPAQLLNMGKMTDLLSSIGLTPGRKAMRSEMRYGRVVIATDADFDGSDIFTLLINLFFTHWPELFDRGYQPFVYRLLAPNVCLTKGKKRIHFPTREAYEKGKGRYKGWTVHYYKGLGSMSRADWEMVLESDDTLIPVQDDGNMKEALELLFGPSADARKDWLQEEETQ